MTINETGRRWSQTESLAFAAPVTYRQADVRVTDSEVSQPAASRAPSHHTARSGTVVLPATAPCPPQPHPHPHPISRYRLRITLGVRAACLSAMWLNLLTATAGSVVSLSLLFLALCVCVKYRVCLCKWICEWAWTCVCVCMCVLWVSTHTISMECLLEARKLTLSLANCLYNYFATICQAVTFSLLFL